MALGVLHQRSSGSGLFRFDAEEVPVGEQRGAEEDRLRRNGRPDGADIGCAAVLPAAWRRRCRHRDEHDPHAHRRHCSVGGVRVHREEGRRSDSRSEAHAQESGRLRGSISLHTGSCDDRHPDLCGTVHHHHL